MKKYQIIIGLILLFSFYFSVCQPLYGDEGLYSIAIKDNIELGLQPTATYFGATMYWKPSLIFNIYGLLATPFYNHVPEEILFRSVSFLFVILSLIILFKFFQNEFNDNEKAYWGIIFILITPAFFGFSIRVLTDTLAFFFFGLLLYTSQKFEKVNKFLFLISIIGIGLTKSIVLSILGIMIGIVYYVYRNKKINYQMLILCFISLVMIIGYGEIFQTNKLVSGDLARTNRIRLDRIINTIMSNVFFFGMVILSIFFTKDKKNLVYLFCLFFLLYIIINGLGHLPWYIFPILPFFSILAVNCDLGKHKEMITILIIWNFMMCMYLISGLNFSNLNMEVASELNLQETIYIGRLGEVVANKIYDSNGVMVSTQNSFFFQEGEMMVWGGETSHIDKENLLGLIYEYEDPKWYPKYLNELDEEERYIPPITRTYKKFEGPFRKIIIEEQYFVKIEEEILKDYEIVMVIDEEKDRIWEVEEIIYVLSIKK